MSRLNGLFHGLLADPVNGSVELFNDRYGMHRLCYHESEGAFYFAPKPKGSWLRVPICACLLRKAWENFWPAAAFWKIAPSSKTSPSSRRASRWIFRNGALKQKETYFDPKEWEEQEPLDAEAFYKGLRESIAKMLSRIL